MKKVAIIGQGYVGLTLSVFAAEHFDVIGFDSNELTVSQLNQGISHIEGISGADIGKFLRKGNYKATSKGAQAVQLFQASNLLDSAHKYAMEAVKFNPDYFDAWKQIYYLPNSSESEKAIALENLKRLDPRNPDPTKNYD